MQLPLTFSRYSSLLLLSPSLPSAPPLPCVAYLGAYGSQTISHVFHSSPECLRIDLAFGSELSNQAQFVPVELGGQGAYDVVHLSPRPLDGDVFDLGDGWNKRVMGEIEASTLPHSENARILHSSQDTVILQLPSSALGALYQTIDTLYTAPVLLPSPSSQASSFVPVSDHDAKRVQAYLDSLAFDPKISKALLAFPSTQQFKTSLDHLTGATHQEWNSRHSFSTGGEKASKWIQSQFEKNGALCRLQKFRNGYNPNVICYYEGVGATPTEDGELEDAGLVVVGAHYDSRGTFGDLRAPGGDDDGSGTSMLLAISQAIHEQRIKFKKTVILAAFAGEEQGLVGSAFFASGLRREGGDVALMIQGDMLGYRKPGEPLQLAFPDRFDLPVARDLIGNISSIYVPELAIGVTGACCSDHQSFFNQGFASTQVFERRGPIADPMYHNSGDVVDREGYDIEQIRAISRVVFATVLEVAGFES
ncbi:Zn-dependent exopeptidase [Atractiella rhizophila]|nr:Zn-dependent exopeptidase [Atractiella rhizophila]